MIAYCFNVNVGHEIFSYLSDLWGSRVSEHEEVVAKVCNT